MHDGDRGTIRGSSPGFYVWSLNRLYILPIQVQGCRDFLAALLLMVPAILRSMPRKDIETYGKAFQPIIFRQLYPICHQFWSMWRLWIIKSQKVSCQGMHRRKSVRPLLRNATYFSYNWRTSFMLALSCGSSLTMHAASVFEVIKKGSNLIKGIFLASDGRVQVGHISLSKLAPMLHSSNGNLP